MAYQDIQAAQVVALPHEADLGDFSADKLAIVKLSAHRSPEWVRRVITLLDEAVRQLHPSEEVAQGTVLEAASLLRKQIEPAQELPVLVADLCALIDRSEAHFSRSFKRTFGESPHAFVIRRRLELAARYMLQTDASLSDIALRCGFTDQAHLCKHFRQSTGQTPAAWRRARRTPDSGDSVAILSREGVLARRVGSNHRQGREF
jgi:AraC-like DNA-binding protein